MISLHEDDLVSTANMAKYGSVHLIRSSVYNMRSTDHLGALRKEFYLTTVRLADKCVSSGF